MNAVEERSIIGCGENSVYVLCTPYPYLISDCIDVSRLIAGLSADPVEIIQSMQWKYIPPSPHWMLAPATRTAVSQLRA